MIYITAPSNAIELIFYKLMFYFDKFQPGDIRFGIGLSDFTKMPVDVDIPTDVAKKLMFKLGPEDEIAIAMAQIEDEDNDFKGLILLFPKIPYTPKIVVKENGAGVGLGCDDAALRLRSDMSKADAREAFEFFITKISAIVSECTGN